jgi:hypothetical protein
MPDSESGKQKVRKTKKATAPRSRKSLLARALKTFEKKLIAEKDLRPTLAEYLKLLQVERELEPEPPREITVTWVESPPDTSEEK